VRYCLLVRHHGMARTGAWLDAARSAQALLQAQLWPLWRHTPHRAEVAAGDAVAVYLAGAGRVIASARVERIGRWTRALIRRYPLMLDGVPAGVLHLADVQLFEHAVEVRERLARLSFVRRDGRGWGTYFSNGLRFLAPQDFAELTSATANDGRPLRLPAPAAEMA
jgi:hypothetical protein